MFIDTNKKEIILYIFFGGLATIICIGSFALFTSLLGINELIANVFSWIITVLFAFFTNQIWVFNAKKSKKKNTLNQIFSFYCGRLFTLGVEELILFIFITKLKLSAIVIKICAQFIVIVLNYVISKYFVFKK